jgi:hypothetical protein
MRTRRPRPSEKTASRVIRGLSPLGHPGSGWPIPRGGAGSARPPKNAWASPGHISIRPRPLGHPPRVMKCLGMSKALQSGRGDRVPRENHPSHRFQLFPLGRPSWMAHPVEGRAPHDRRSSGLPRHSPAPFALSVICLSALATGAETAPLRENHP